MKYMPLIATGMFVDLDFNKNHPNQRIEPEEWNITHTCREGVINRINNSHYDTTITSNAGLLKTFGLSFRYPNKISYSRKYFIESMLTASLKMMNPSARPAVSVRTYPYTDSRVLSITTANKYIMTPVKMSFFLGLARQLVSATLNERNTVSEFVKLKKIADNVNSTNDIIDILVESCYVASNSTNLVFDSFKTKAEYKRLLKAHSELIFNTQNWSSDIDSFNQTQGFRYMILTYINEVLEEE